MVLLFKMAPENGLSEVWCSVPKCKKAAMRLMEKVCVLDKLPLGMSYSVGCEFNVNESTIMK